MKLAYILTFAASCAAVPFHGCKYTLREPPPKGYYCDAGGLVADPNFLGQPFPTTFEKCKNVCLYNPACISFLYKVIEGQTLGQCAPYTSALTQETYILIGERLGNIYYNRHCFKSNNPAKCGGI